MLRGSSPLWQLRGLTRIGSQIGKPEGLKKYMSQTQTRINPPCPMKNDPLSLGELGWLPGGILAQPTAILPDYVVTCPYTSSRASKTHDGLLMWLVSNLWGVRSFKSFRFAARVVV